MTRWPTITKTTAWTAAANTEVWPDMKRPLEQGGIVRRTPGDKMKNRRPHTIK
jgi:hypothetical protein